MYIDPLNANLSTLLVQLFRDSLNEYAYAAEIAGLKYNLNSTAYGITVSCDKGNDTLLDFFCHFSKGDNFCQQEFSFSTHVLEPFQEWALLLK